MLASSIAIQPMPIVVSFIFTTLLSIYLFWKSSNQNKYLLLFFAFILLVQTYLTSISFYQNYLSIPPRFIFLLIPAIISMLIIFNSKIGMSFVSKFDLRYLTLIHIVRIPVEIVLYYLAINKLVPSMMTFEGLNFDIISGISAIVVYYLYFVKKQSNKKYLLVWNYVCLLLLINIVSIAILSLPTKFQVLSLQQANIGVGYFPFVFLPSIIVPIVAFSHFAAISQLKKQI